jgi:hypothetical protein
MTDVRVDHPMGHLMKNYQPRKSLGVKVNNMVSAAVDPSPRTVCRYIHFKML